MKLAFFALFAALGFASTAEVVGRVNCFIGTGGTGHCFPAASYPFGLVQAGPDTGWGTWDYCSGYRYEDRQITMFSQTHNPGGGCPDYADVGLMPFVGNMATNVVSPFSHANETASPGYYAVTLDRGNIRVEVSATERASIYRITAPEAENLRLLVDLDYGMGNLTWAKKTVKPLKVERLADGAIRALLLRSGFVKGRHIGVELKFNPAPVSVEELPAEPGVHAPKFVLSFGRPADGRLIVKCGLSVTDGEGAARNLAQEIPGWDFDAVRLAARQKWREVLSRIEVEDDDADRTAMFETAVYRLFLVPTNIADVDGRTRGGDGKFLRMPNGRYYSELSLWDTFRGAHPLYTLVAAEYVPDFVNSMIAHQKAVGFLPVLPKWGRDSQCMIATHAVAVIADAYFKGFGGVDWPAAYQAVRATLRETHPMRGKEDWDLLDAYGYYPCDKLKGEGVSRTLECSYDDWCAWKMAEKLGTPEDAVFFKKRAHNWTNVLDRATGFMRGRLTTGAWREPFDPYRCGHETSWEGDFTEGNAWQWRWHVLQDPAGLVAALGGKARAAALLDELFNLPSDLDSTHTSPDVTGLLGQYVQGNEPSHHIPYLYQYAGRPDRAAECIRQLCEKFYFNRPDGLCGNEDHGEMSAWYVFACMGFYPVNPSEGTFVIGAPQVSKVTLRLADGKTFVIRAKNLSKANRFVKSVKLNGRPLNGFLVSYADIIAGGELVFEMTDRRGEGTSSGLFADFVDPPDSAKPWTYWFWTNSLTDRETIVEEAKDIAELGFGGILLTDSRGYWDDDNHVRNPPATIRWGGEAWLDIVEHAVREAARNNLKVSLNIAASGGHLRGDEDVGADAPKFLKYRCYRPREPFEKPTIPHYREVAVFAVKTAEPVAVGGWQDAGDGFFSMEGNVGKRMNGAELCVHRALDVRELASPDEGASFGPGWTIVRLGVGTAQGHEVDIDVLDRTAVTRHLDRVVGNLIGRLPGLVGHGKTLVGLYNVSWEGLMPTWSSTFEQDFEKYEGYGLRALLPILAGFDLPTKSRSDFMRDFRHARGRMMCEHLYGTVRDWAGKHGLIAFSESGGPWGDERNPRTFGECDQLGFLAANDFPQGEFWPLAENGTAPVSRHANANGRFLTKGIVSAAHIYDRPFASAEAFTHMHRHWSVDPAFLKPLGDQAFADGINLLVWHTYTTSPQKRFGTPGLEYFAGSHINRNVTWHDDFAPMVKYISRCQLLLQAGRPVTDVAVLVGDRAYAGWGTKGNGRLRNVVSSELPVKVPKGFAYDAINDEALRGNPGLLSRYRIVHDARKPENRMGMVETGGLLPDVETSADYTWCHRRIDTTDIYFLAGEGKATLTFRSAGESVEIWDAVHGRRSVADAAHLADGRTRVNLELPIGGSCFVVFGGGLEGLTSLRGLEEKTVSLGSWNVSFAYPRGISAKPPEPVVLDRLVDFTTREDLKHFSGTATYRTTFRLSVPRRVRLALGTVPSGLTHVYLNGRDCGTVWCAPWEADLSSAVRDGENNLEIRYVNNWYNRLVGDCSLSETDRVTRSVLRYWDVPRQGTQPWKITPTVYSGYSSYDTLQSSGLLGPIVVKVEL